LNTATLILRADASTQIGIGHFTRSLSLARAWQESGGRAVLISRCDSPDLLNRAATLVAEVVALEEGDRGIDQVLAKVPRQPDAWVCLDGYDFGVEDQQRFKDEDINLLVIDDYVHAERYVADVILNQNLDSIDLSYPSEPDTELLLGTRYCLLSPEFRQWRGDVRVAPRLARRVLVSLGGSDPDNVTMKVVQALGLLTDFDLEATVVVGPSNPHFAALNDVLTAADRPHKLVRAAANMPELMHQADVAVSAGGATCWELAIMGVPFATLTIADNQRPNAANLDAANVSMSIGWHADADPARIAQVLAQLVEDQPRRQAMSEAGQKLVDGDGANRVVAALRARLH